MVDVKELRKDVEWYLNANEAIEMDPRVVLALLDALQKHETEDLALIEDRDLRENQIDEIADVLGDESEWSNFNDRGNNAINLASNLVNELNLLRATMAVVDGNGKAYPSNVLSMLEEHPRLLAVLKNGRLLDPIACLHAFKTDCGKCRGCAFLEAVRNCADIDTEGNG